MPHYTLLRQSQWIDLPALLAVEQDSPLYNVKSQAPLFYAESWALVHMLYLGDDYRPKLRGLLDCIKAGASMADTFQKAYGKSVEQVETDLRSYMGAKRFNASLFNTRLAAASEPETAEAGPREIGPGAGGDRGECAGQSRPGAGTVQRVGARQPQGLADRGRAGTAEPAGTEDRRGRTALRARSRTGQHERQNVS